MNKCEVVSIVCARPGHPRYIPPVGPVTGLKFPQTKTNSPFALYISKGRSLLHCQETAGANKKFGPKEQHGRQMPSRGSATPVDGPGPAQLVRPGNSMKPECDHNNDVPERGQQKEHSLATALRKHRSQRATTLREIHARSSSRGKRGFMKQNVPWSMQPKVLSVLSLISKPMGPPQSMLGRTFPRCV